MFSRIYVLVLLPVVLTLVFAATHASADERLAIDVSPAFCLAPCMVTVNVSVDPHELHRELLVEADSFSFYRSSFIDLEGEREPLMHRVEWKSLPEGVYEVRATVRRLDGEWSQVSERIRIIGQ